MVSNKCLSIHHYRGEVQNPSGLTIYPSDQPEDTAVIISLGVEALSQ